MSAETFPYDVFLSHSAKDKAVVRPLAERLRADGVKVWFDEWVLNLGDSIAKAPEGQRIRLLLKALRPAQPPLILDNLESLPQGDRNQLFTFVKRLQPG